MKRGTRVEYTFAAGKVVAGKVIGPYAKDMPDWWLLELIDEAGTFRAGCHIGQIRVVDNRQGYSPTPE